MTRRHGRSTFARLVAVGVGMAALGLAVAPASARLVERICWPGFTIRAVHLAAVHLPATTIPAVTIPAVTIPAVTIPRTCIAGHCYPARHYPAQHYPARHYPAQHLPAVNIRAQTIPAQHIQPSCFTVPAAFAPHSTTVRVKNYAAIDSQFSGQASNRYWRSGGTMTFYPDPLAAGYGQLNAAGFPKNQYVRSYLRRDGTFVSGYWRNSPTDGLPTCRIIRC